MPDPVADTFSPERRSGWDAGVAYAEKQGLADGREIARRDLAPYVQHVGNCGAAGGDPDDSRCICGLRQVWMARRAT